MIVCQFFYIRSLWNTWKEIRVRGRAKPAPRTSSVRRGIAGENALRRQTASASLALACLKTQSILVIGVTFCACQAFSNMIDAWMQSRVLRNMCWQWLFTVFALHKLNLHIQEMAQWNIWIIVPGRALWDFGTTPANQHVFYASVRSLIIHTMSSQAQVR